MKKMIILFALVSFGTNAQTVLYESVNFIDWVYSNNAQNHDEQYNSDYLWTQSLSADTIKINLVKAFTTVSGLDSILVKFQFGSNTENYKCNFYTSIDNVNWNYLGDFHPISSTQVGIFDSLTIYQQSLNTSNNITYLRCEAVGFQYSTPVSQFLNTIAFEDIDIITYVDATTSVSEVKSDIKAFVLGGHLKIESKSILKSIKVFSLDGRLIYRNDNLNDNKTTIPMMEQGIYIVHVNETDSIKIYIQ